MSECLELTILTPERKIFNGEVKELTTENDIGRLEILPKHITMVTLLSPTVTSFTTLDGLKYKLFTSTGILKVKNNEINLLCETAEWPEEIDINRAEEARKKAEKHLKNKAQLDYKKEELRLKRAVARIKAKD
ncbi:F0F1 ATP synthase subunit epsilon [Clostridium sp. SYSU_GA19001]|uniref:F0F1 ATP synthase subunit epsilon n=1 Tax=Clostridium caldaquaticum TaxID=2940653 RepID=UPI002077282E|nr:F0F1 ATP synthase subunit epsilon [Clostridium caldaquaticum]MCM8711646.1 F0F1 ATP synthase subunit epsilon [Clostridium caldaquaticum]